jgi:ribonucleotide monophosphatase NagD (HAD superfamily)
MFFEAQNDFNLDLKNCLIIGDSYIDIKAGLMLEMDTMLVLTGNGENSASRLAEDETPTYIVKDLSGGAKELCL